MIRPCHSRAPGCSCLMVLTSAAVASVVTLAQTRPAQTRPAPTAPRRRPLVRACPADARWLRAVDAWEAGSIRRRFEDLRALIQSPAAAEYFERVALLTGELYVVDRAHDRRPQSEDLGQRCVRELRDRHGPIARDARRAHRRPRPPCRRSSDDDRRVRSQRTPPGVAARDRRHRSSRDRNRRARSDERERAVWLGPGLQKSGLVVVGRRPERDLRRADRPLTRRVPTSTACARAARPSC